MALHLWSTASAKPVGKLPASTRLIRRQHPTSAWLTLWPPAETLSDFARGQSCSGAWTGAHSTYCMSRHRARQPRPPHHRPALRHPLHHHAAHHRLHHLHPPPPFHHPALRHPFSQCAGAQSNCAKAVPYAASRKLCMFQLEAVRLTCKTSLSLTPHAA